MRRRTLVVAATAACSLFLVAADDPPPADVTLPAAVQKIMSGALDLDLDDGGSLPKFETVTKDMKASAGLFTLWQYPEEATDKDQEKLLCQIPAAFLGQQFMLSTSVAGGGFFTGFPLDERVVRWELLDRQLLLVEPETGYVVDEGKEVADAVKRTYPARIRAAVPLLTKSPAGDPVIDLGALLKSDFADISWMTFDPTSPFGGFGGASINSQLSKWSKKKAFELNVEIGVELAVASSSPPGSYDKKLIHFSFWKLPETGYQPRIADDRVGYFLTANQDWSRPTNERDLYNRYVNRWQIEKRDPSLKLCEPKQPIIYYIEKTVPVRFRRAVRDGILEWNKAFEKIGFVNAVEVRQQTDDNEWKDLDPEDMRYSFFRWIVTGGGFAMGPSRVNPFTGQIYDADIIFDDSMVRFFEQEAEHMLPSALVQQKLSDPALKPFVERHADDLARLHDWELPAAAQDHTHLLRRAAQARMAERGHHGCDYCQQMKHQMLVGHAMLADQPPGVRDRFLYDVIKEVVMHEVGHTLGLRHNFMASTIYSLEEIRAKARKGQATVGSVMDYNATLFFRDGGMDHRFLPTTIGPWDYWVIEYGYRPFDGNFKADGEADDEGKKAAAKAPPAEAPKTTESPAEVQIELADIPPEVLAQMPPEVREALQSGDLARLMAQASSGAGGGTPRTPTAAIQGPKFASAPAGEEAMLRAIAARCTEPELAYATDEDTTFMSPDPRSNRFDVGADPIDWAEERLALAEKRLENVLEWAVREDESWYHLRPAFLSLMFERVQVLDYVGRYIGGQYFSRAHRGDKDAPPPLKLVDPKLQRRALEFIEKNLYRDTCFKLCPDVLNHLTPSRWAHSGNWPSGALDFPAHDFIAVFQWWNLFDRLYPDVLRRIRDAELKCADGNVITAAEYVQTIQNAVWADALDLERLTKGKWTDREPFLSSIRRSLQREYLGIVEPLVRERPGQSLSPDLHALVVYSVRQLGRQLEPLAGAEGADFASRAHLYECKSRIDRMLSAELGETRGASSASFLLGRPAGAAGHGR